MAFSIGYATFIENDFGSSTSKLLIYNVWWFELILILLTITLTINIFKQNLFRKRKISHTYVSFVIHNNNDWCWSYTIYWIRRNDEN